MSETIFFIVPYPFGEAPSQRFRFEQYLTFLEENGYKIHIHPFLNDSTWKTLYQEGNTLKKIAGISGSFWRRFLLLFQLRRANHIYIHREAAQLGPPIFEWIIAKVLRRKFIYDFDDAIWLPNYSDTNARFQRLKSYWKVNYCMKWADKITAGNAYLANYAKQYNSNVQIIPTTIDTIHHHNRVSNQSTEKPTIGWTGTHTTMHYLEEILPIIIDLENDFSFDFLIISNEPPRFELTSLKFIKWSKETEIEDLAKITIGIMPLKQDIWSEGKCGFKGLQYMALEIATVLAPIGVNKTIIEDSKNGFLAENLAEWKEKLTVLLENEAKRIQLGKAGKRTIDERFSVVANQEKYLKLFTNKS